MKIYDTNSSLAFLKLNTSGEHCLWVSISHFILLKFRMVFCYMSTIMYVYSFPADGCFQCLLLLGWIRWNLNLHHRGFWKQAVLKLRSFKLRDLWKGLLCRGVGKFKEPSMDAEVPRMENNRKLLLALGLKGKMVPLSRSCICAETHHWRVEGTGKRIHLPLSSRSEVSCQYFH